METQAAGKAGRGGVDGVGERRRATAAVSMRVTLVEDAARLWEHQPAWENLAEAALEPNVFYEPWVVRPALEAFTRDGVPCFALVYDESGVPPVLCGLFPLERASRYRGFPLHHFTLWKHVHCYLCTPLLRRGYARPCLSAFLEWLATDPRGASVMEWKLVGSDGPVFETLTSLLDETQNTLFRTQSSTRALLQRHASGPAYLEESLPGKSRKEFRRLERRLAEAGRLEYVDLVGPEAAGAWAEEFLSLEASGWKGRQATALACTEEGRRFFTRVAAEAARRDRLMMLALRLDGRPVALKCNFLAGEGSFAFKIAFDEGYGRFSPGVLLELENVRRFHARPGLAWMDSCATDDHFMANRLWLDRRGIATLLTAASRTPGDLVVSTLPLLRPLYLALRGRRP